MAWAVQNWLSACWRSWEPSSFSVQGAESPGKSRSGTEGLEDCWRATGLWKIRDAGFCQHWTVSVLTNKTVKAELLLCIWPHRKVLSTLREVLPFSVNPSWNYLPHIHYRRVSQLLSDFLKLTIKISYHNSYCSWNLSGFEESWRKFIVLYKNAMLWNLCKISYDFQNHTGNTVMAGADYQLNGIWNHLGVCVWQWGIKLIKLTGVGDPSYKWVAPFPGQHRKGDSSATPVLITPCLLTLKMRWSATSSFCCLVFSTMLDCTIKLWARQTLPSFLRLLLSE